jgi:transposase
MLTPELRCVVGSDVAKQAHVVCALEAPAGAVRHKPSRIEATAEGYALLRSWLETWAEGGSPETVLIGLEATGSLWEPLYETLTHAGYTVLLLNPRQTASWASSLGLRAKTDGIDAQTRARGVLAGWARGSTLPSATVQALRALTRARRDLIQSRTMARQRLHDELVVLFPEFVRFLPSLPGRTDLGDPAILQLLSASSSAHALAQRPLDELTDLLARVSGGRWGPDHAQALQTLALQTLALQTLARRSTASSRAVVARSIVARTLAPQLLELAAHLGEVEAAIAELLHDDVEGQQLPALPGSGPQGAATIRAELGDVTRFSRVDEVVAYAGLDPRTRQSGAFSGQMRLSKRGPGALRHALYLAAFVAARCAPEWRIRYQRLLDRGRAKTAAYTILARALLRVIYHLLRTGEAYDPTLLNRQAPVPAC